MDNNSTINAKKTTNTNISSGFLPWLIWGLAAMFFLAEYFIRVAPSVMVPNLMHSFAANSLAVGTLSAMFYYAYIPMQVPVGALVDALSTRWLLSSMALLCGLSTLAYCATDSFMLAAVARFTLGFAAAFAFVGALKLAYSWFPSQRFAFLAGSTQALGMLGAAIGEGPVSILVKNFGWRLSMALMGALLCVLALFMLLIIRDKKAKKKSKNIWSLAASSFDGIKDVLKQPMIWLNGIFIGFLYAPTQSFAELWGPSYLHNVYHLSSTMAAGLISLIFFGWAIGSPLAGLLSDRLRRRKPILWASATLSLVTMSIILYAPHLGETSLAILLLCYGLSNVGVATAYAVAAEISSAGHEGTAMGFTNMASISIGAILQPLLGFLLDQSQHTKIAATKQLLSDTANHYRVSMSLLPLCFVVCLVTCYFIKESYGTQK